MKSTLISAQSPSGWWEIAEAYYGGGWHYRAIVRDNRRKIHNPHWIYPKQKFHIPAR